MTTYSESEVLSILPIGHQIGLLDYHRNWLSEEDLLATSGNKSAASLLGLPKAVVDQGSPVIDDLCEVVIRYIKDLESSAMVQRNLLVGHPPELKNMEISVKYIPMMGVSGDYYDFLPIDRDRIGIGIGDVCGKGMPAAILMACVLSALRAQMMSNSEAVGKLMSTLNKTVKCYANEDRFVTCAYGTLDIEKHTFIYSSAGHPPILHYRATTGDVCELDVGGGILGIWEDMEYPSETILLGAGDVLVLYTDGIIEANNGSEEFFGIDRLKDVVAKHGIGTAENLQDKILSEVFQFSGHNWDDDITIVVIKMKEYAR